MVAAPLVLVSSTVQSNLVSFLRFSPGKGPFTARLSTDATDLMTLVSFLDVLYKNIL